MNVSTMSVREMKDVLKAAGVSAVGVTEKDELRELAREAVKKVECEKCAGFAKGVSKVDMGGWACKVINPCSEVKHVVVMLHGFGATNEDFAVLAERLQSDLPHVLWVFPQANVDSSLGATAWWKINVAEWMASAQGGGASLASIIRKRHDGLDACREQGAALLKAISTKTGLPLSAIHLSGFSQGAMTAMDIALNAPEAVGSVAMISGAPIVIEEWAAKLQEKSGKLKIFVSHGKIDAVLPCAASNWAVELFEEHGDVKVDYHSHPGGHELGGMQILSALGGFWKSACI